MWHDESLERKSTLKDHPVIRVPVFRSDEGIKLVSKGVGPELRVMFDYVDADRTISIAFINQDGRGHDADRSVVVSLRHAVEMFRRKNPAIGLTTADIQTIKDVLQEALPMWKATRLADQVPITNVIFE